MKSLHLTNAWHAASGGVGTFYRALLDAANRERVEMRLVVPGDSTRIERAGDHGLIYYIEAPKAPFDPRYRMIYPYRFLFPRTAIQRILNSEQPDLVEISEKYTLPYLGGLLRTSRLPGVNFRPVVIGSSHERMDENVAAYVSGSPAAMSFCRRYMKSIYFPLFDHHLAFSKHTADELIPASKGHKVRRGIWVSPMGVDCDRFSAVKRTPEGRARLISTVGAGSDSTILLYVGRLSPEKNPMLLLETMARLSGEFHLCIAGGGPLLETMRQRCARERIAGVTFLGHVADRSALGELYANADAFVHPNPREPFGIAPLEAMAAGLPVIVPNSGGVTSYANQSNAILAPPDAGSFARAAISVRANPEANRIRAAAAQVTAADHRWETVTSGFLRLYRELIAITRDGSFSQTIPPYAWSTPGDKWGREVPETNLLKNVSVRSSL